MYSKQQIIDTLNNEDIYIDNFLLEAFIKNWKIEPIYEDAEGVEFFDDMAVEKVRNGILQKQPKCEINIVDKDFIKPIDMSVEISHDAVVDAKEPESEVFTQEVVAQEEISQVVEETQVVEENIEQERLDDSQEITPEQCCQNENDVVQTEIIDEHSVVQELPVAILNEVNKEVENELKNVTLDISNQTLAVLAESIARKITSDVSEFIKRTDFIEDAVQLGEYKKDNELLLEKIEELIADNKALIEKVKELEKDSNSYVKLFGNVYMKNR